MNKTIDINLGGLIFHVDEDAFKKLERYMSAVKAKYANTPGGAEIIEDIESRLAELFRQINDQGKEVISLQDVEDVTATMGAPEEFEEIEDEQQDHQKQTYYQHPRRMFRDGERRVIGGVSAGLASYFKIDVIWIRLLFIVLLFAGLGGLLIYLILWIAIPKATTTTDRLMMHGEPVTIASIERSIKTGAEKVEYKARDVGNKVRNYDYSRTGSSMAHASRGFGNVIAQILRVFLKIIGILLIALGIIFLITILIAVIGALFVNFENGNPLASLKDIMPALAFHNSYWQVLSVGLGMALLAPLFLLFYWGLRIIFNLEPLNTSVKGGLALVALIGFIMVIGSAASVGFAFKQEASFTRKQTLPAPADTWYIMAEQDSISRFFNHQNHQGFYSVDNRFYFNMVELDIRQARDSVSYLEYEIEAFGPTYRKALKHTRELPYQARQSGDTLRFKPYYELTKNKKFYAHTVDATLYLATGQKVYLHPSAESVVFDIENLQNYWDQDMLGYTWQMTAAGLNCVDCPESENDRESISNDTLVKNR